MTWPHPALGQRDLDESDAEIERLKVEVMALHAVIHMVWVETSDGTTAMPDDARAAVQRALAAYLP